MPNRKCADRNSPAANEVPAAPDGTPPGQPPAAPENAASIASMFLTTECVLAEKKSDAPAMPAMPAGGMGGMM